MRRKPIFDAIRRLLGRGLRQREVDAIDAALDAASPQTVAPVPNRAASGDAIALIKRFEGLARRIPGGLVEAYPDPGTGGAPWTIGWGATGPEIGPGTVWTEAQAEDRLRADIARHAAEVAEALGDAPTTQAQFDALVSFHYNTGAIARATLTRKHVAGDYPGAAAEFARWNRAGGHVLRGLARRRAAEAALYLGSQQSVAGRNPDAAVPLSEPPGDKQMLRLFGVAVLALAVATPAHAQGKGDDKGAKDRSGKPERAVVDAGRKDGGDEARQRAPGQQARPGRSRSDRDDSDRNDRGGRPESAPGAGRERSADTARARTGFERAGYRVDPRRVGGDRADDETWVDRERVFASVPACPPGLARKNNGCLPPGIARKARDEAFGFAYRPALFGVPLRAAADYVYYDGYLIPSGGGAGRYLPLLGGALAVGQLWPEAYPSLTLADWQRDYYGFDDPDAYRYADNVIYEVDPATSAIEAVAALLTGNDFTVGEPMPAGYDVYNLPSDYQDRYVDSDDALYRYADGRIYEIDPVTMLIEQAIDLVA